jgi:uncharacterized protein involved in exopolysaccharide biosynthesis
MIKNDGENIDLTLMFRNIVNEKRTIFKSITIFVIIGIIIALGNPKEYYSETTILADSPLPSGGMNGLLQQFGGLAGININNSISGQMLSPEVYPDIIKSSPFLIEILNLKVLPKSNKDSITLFTYLKYNTKLTVLSFMFKYTLGLPSLIFNHSENNNLQNSNILYSNSGKLILSKSQDNILKDISRRITIKEDLKKNMFVIGVQVQDPYVCSDISDNIISLLMKYAIAYKIEKAQQDMKFVSKLCDDAKIRYEKALYAYASYKDQHKNIILATSSSGEDRLKNDFDLTYKVYSGLAQQLEQSKIKVQENTPLIKIINPAQFPIKASSPNKALILIGYLLLGFFMGICMILFKIYIKQLK